ncbi:hypothetical protein VP01_14368g2, partial [Puccinia sorghi]
WKSLSQARSGPNADSQTPPASTPLNPTAQPDATNDSPTTAANSFKRQPGVHETKGAMKEENFNAKKIKMLLQHSNNYRERTMKKTNEI